MRGNDADGDDSIERHLLEGMVLIMGGEAELGQSSFTYDAPTGEVHVTTRLAERVIQIIVVPVGAASLSPTPAADPYASESTEPVANESEVEAEPITGIADFASDSSAADIAPLEGFQPGAQLPPLEQVEPALPDGETDPFENAFLTDTKEVQHFASSAALDESSEPDFEPPAFESGPATEFTPPQGFATHDSTESETSSEFAPPESAPSPELSATPELSVDASVPTEFSPLPELSPLPEIVDLPNDENARPTATEADVLATDEAESSRLRPIDQIDDSAAPVFEPRSDAPAMDRLFHKMVGKGCSDLHVSAGNVPLFRKDGRITDLGGEPQLSAGQVESLLMGITPDRFRKQFEERNDTDFAYEIEGVARFRCNLFRDRNGVGGVFRQIPADILSADQLGINRGLLEMCQLKKGLILVTGPTGSGKSTTLAALIDHINNTRQDHIITIEDPIEFVHKNRKCLINQREVGEHTKSFKVALRAALREDPDIVLVGELRDLETVEIALETAETGHLVFGTLHTNTAAGTVSRLIDQFPAGQQAQIRTMLADTLQAVIAQTLCRKIKGGRVAALEILVATNAVSNLIREDKTHQILSAMQTGGAQGMKTLNDALLELVQQKIVDPQEAYWNAVDKTEFRALLSRNGITVEDVEVAVAS